MAECPHCQRRIDNEPIPLGDVRMVRADPELLPCSECGEDVCTSCANNGLCPSCAKWERP